MGKLEEAIDKLSNAKSLIEQLVEIEIEREKVIASYFPSFSNIDKELISERVYNKFMYDLEEQILNAYDEDLRTALR
jgi:hypothetical protein